MFDIICALGSTIRKGRWGIPWRELPIAFVRKWACGTVKLPVEPPRWQTWLSIFPERVTMRPLLLCALVFIILACSTSPSQVGSSSLSVTVLFGILWWHHPAFFFDKKQGKLIVLSNGIPPGGPEVGMRMAGLEQAHAEANEGKDALQPCPGKMHSICSALHTHTHEYSAFKSRATEHMHVNWISSPTGWMHSEGANWKICKWGVINIFLEIARELHTVCVAVRACKVPLYVCMFSTIINCVEEMGRKHLCASDIHRHTLREEIVHVCAYISKCTYMHVCILGVYTCAHAYAYVLETCLHVYCHMHLQEYHGFIHTLWKKHARMYMLGENTCAYAYVSENCTHVYGCMHVQVY